MGNSVQVLGVEKWYLATGTIALLLILCWMSNSPIFDASSQVPDWETPFKSHHCQLAPSTMSIQVFATDNLYADMLVPFTVKVRLADTITDERISGASVTITAHYFSGPSPPWNVTLAAPEESLAGWYSAAIAHTGAGHYNFTAFASASGYELASAWILREVRTRETFDYGWPPNPAIWLALGTALIVFATILIAVYFGLKRRKQ